MTRTYVVTGSASGIGRATCEHLERAGHRVLDVDLKDAGIVTDLATPEGRAAMVEAVDRAAGGTVDAVVANAGTTTPELCVPVNYFGAVATLVGLRPLLARSPAPRAVATASTSVLNIRDNDLVAACLDGDEPAALKVADGGGLLNYPASKRALARWVRRTACTDDWAGAGIPLNAVAPGITTTPMTKPFLADDDLRALLEGATPMPLGGHAAPGDVAVLIAFLTAAENTRITGQVVFVDGGTDVVLRGDDIF